MKARLGSRWRLRVEDALFVVALAAAIALLAWLGGRHAVIADWTAAGRNTLAEASRETLDRLEGPLTITAYASEDPALRERIERLVDRYRRVKPGIDLRFLDPSAAPDELRRLEIEGEGALRLEHRGRTEHVAVHTEEAFTNALHRLARGGERWLAYVTGHGERDLRGGRNHDLGEFGGYLERRGFRLQPLTLADVDEVPANAAAVVLAGPAVDLLPVELERLLDFVEGGGNLLLLADPEPPGSVIRLAAALGLELTPGVLVDPRAPLAGVADPTFVVASRYERRHPLTTAFDLVTLYPRATALRTDPPESWRATELVTTDERVWLESDGIERPPRFDAGRDLAGPFAVAVALSRSLSASEGTPREQRLIAVGDGDFLANAYLGNGGNLELGLAMVEWLSHNDALIAIPVKTAPDVHFRLERRTAFAIALTALLGLPLALVAAGAAIWWRRRRL